MDYGHNYGQHQNDQMYSGHGGGKGKLSKHQDLRSLLDTENAQALVNMASGCCSTYWGNAYGGRPSMGYTMLFPGDCRCGTCDTSHDWDGYRYKTFWWCAPPGTTNITFEIWGGGGSGGWAQCCQQGNPGGAGAYAIKTLCACCNPATGEPWPGGTFGGMCWEMFIAPATQDQSTCCKGYQGCKSYITGCGLTNFCAEGGMPGKTCCYAFFSGRVCGQADAVGVHTYGPSGTQETACLNEYRPCYPMVCSGMYTFHPCEAAYTCDCACYYGADWGVPGKLGWFRSDCACNFCFAKIAVPNPGGMRSRCTRWHIQQGRCCAYDHTCRHDGLAGEMVKHCFAGQHPGKGGASGASSGGNCNGHRGSPGFIRVHYF